MQECNSSALFPAQTSRPKEGGFVAGINYVLIRPEADYDTLAGLLISGQWEMERQWSVFGRVVAVPERLWFARHVDNNLVYNQFVSDNSLEFDAEMELAVGDRVMFRYNVRMDDECVYQDEDGFLLMVRYDMIYMRIDDDIHPVNGWVFVKDGEVVAVGKPHNGYLHYPERQDFKVTKGDLVRYSPRRAVRMEVPEFAELGGIMRIQRKEILVKNITYL